MTKITAHRGDVENFPENTMAAFKSASEKGAERIELDVHATSDNNIVVHHNYSVRSTSDRKLIYEESLADIRSLNADIPLLSDVFKELGNSVEYEIELKGFTQVFLSEVIKICQDYSLLDRIEFTSPHSFILNSLRDKEPTVAIGLILQPFPNWMDDALGIEIALNAMTIGRYNVLHLPYQLLSTELVERLLEQGYKVHAADINEEDQLRKAYQLKVDQLSTDKLSLAQLVRGRVSNDRLV